MQSQAIRSFVIAETMIEKQGLHVSKVIPKIDETSSTPIDTEVKTQTNVIPPISEFHTQIFQKNYPWLTMPVKDLYLLTQAFLQNQVKPKHPSESRNTEFYFFELPRNKEDTRENPQDEACLDNNVSILSALQFAFGYPEITTLYKLLPSVPQGKQVAFPISLAAINAQIDALLQEEYLIISQLLLATTLIDKMDLLIEYIAAEEGVILYNFIREGFIRSGVYDKWVYFPENLTQEELEEYTRFYSVFHGYLDQYTYAISGLFHLVSHINQLGGQQGISLIDQVEYILSWVDAAKSVIKPRADYFTTKEKDPLPKKNYSMRFGKMVESLECIQQALLTYKENEVMPVFLAEEFGLTEFKTVTKKSQQNIARNTRFQSKKKPAPKAATPASSTPFQKPQAVHASISTTPQVIAAIKSPSILESDKSIDTLALSAEPISVERIVHPSHVEASSPATSQLSHLVPVTELINASSEPAQLMMGMHPKIAGLKGNSRALYEQLFSDRLIDTKHIPFKAVDKLVKQLGGTTKGVGGSRIHIIFNNKSVATIEQRHGKDRAGELNKLSVSLLKRGLYIAGFSPLGWTDPLSASLEKLKGWIAYSNEQKLSCEKG